MAISQSQLQARMLPRLSQSLKRVVSLSLAPHPRSQLRLLHPRPTQPPLRATSRRYYYQNMSDTIKLYSVPTPNGIVVSILLEELKVRVAVALETCVN